MIHFSGNAAGHGVRDWRGARQNRGQGLLVDNVSSPLQPPTKPHLNWEGPQDLQSLLSKKDGHKGYQGASNYPGRRLMSGGRQVHDCAHSQRSNQCAHTESPYPDPMSGQFAFSDLKSAIVLRLCQIQGSKKNVFELLSS